MVSSHVLLKSKWPPPTWMAPKWSLAQTPFLCPSLFMTNLIFKINMNFSLRLRWKSAFSQICLWKWLGSLDSWLGSATWGQRLKEKNTQMRVSWESLKCLVKTIHCLYILVYDLITETDLIQSPLPYQVPWPLNFCDHTSRCIYKINIYSNIAGGTVLRDSF